MTFRLPVNRVVAHGFQDVCEEVRVLKLDIKRVLKIIHHHDDTTRHDV